MLHLIDRQLIRSYFKAYFVCVVSLLSLYIVVDLFTNMDEFTRRQVDLWETIQIIGIYYAFQMPKYFDKLCEPMILLAGMFTVAWMQRHNEHLPLLSAGVSTYRLMRPVLLSAAAMLGIAVLNQELLIPRVADRLNLQRDDPEGDKDINLAGRGGYEPNGIHIHGERAIRKDRVVRNFCCTIPEQLAGSMIHLTAAEARYVPPGPGPRTGGWELSGTQSNPPDFETWDRTVLEPIDNGKYFLRTRHVNFDALTRDKNWFLTASTPHLYRELHRSDVNRQAPKAVLFHMRLARPVLGMLLVIMGLSVILRDQNRNVFLSAGFCLVLCAVFFAVQLTCKYLGDYDYFPAALAAWLPVLLFGPLAIAQFDAVHT